MFYISYNIVGDYMKKFFSLFALTLLAVTFLVACGEGATPISGKTFKIESMMVGENDISSSYKDIITYKFYDNTFIFEMNVGEDTYSYFLGNYTYENGKITTEITKTVGELETTTNNALNVFKTTNLEYKNNKLIIQANLNDIVYSYTLSV